MSRSTEISRYFDRYVGGCAARFVGPVLNRRRGMPAAPKRIGVFQPTAIGDTIIASGCVEAIQSRFPDATLQFYHGPNNSAAVQMLATSLEAVNTPFVNPVRALSTLRKARLDVAVDLTPWPNLTALYARLAAPVAIGFKPDINSSRALLFDIAVTHRSDLHELDNMKAMAAIFGGKECGMRIARRAITPVAGISPDRLVLCHLAAGGSRAKDKAWPTAHWLELATAIADAGYQIGFTGLAKDQYLVDAVMKHAGGQRNNMISLCGKLKLNELARILAVSPLLITVDTGVLHLAAAVNARSLGLHGPTRGSRWGSRSPNARSMESPHPNAGYINYGFETAHNSAEVMRALKPQCVIEAALDMLHTSAEKKTLNSEVILG